MAVASVRHSKVAKKRKWIERYLNAARAEHYPYLNFSCSLESEAARKEYSCGVHFPKTLNNS